MATFRPTHLRPARSSQPAFVGIFEQDMGNSKPRPRHYESGRLEDSLSIFNNLPRGARCDWHHRARPSSTESRKSRARISGCRCSALAIPGSQAERTVDLVIDGQLNLCIFKEIIHEVLDVLAHKFSRGPEELSRTAVFLSDLAELVATRRKLAVLDDELDNRILECAVASLADIIVKGDRAMLNRKTYEQIRILSLHQFLDAPIP